MLRLYGTDACFSCVAIVIAASGAGRPGLLLLVLPLVGVQWPLARERQQRLDRSAALRAAYRGTATVLRDVVEADDRYTGHALSRRGRPRSLDRRDTRVNADECRAVELAAMLHDIGKICVRKDILDKPGKLNPTEQDIVRHHTIHGEELRKPVGGMFARVGRFVRASHERYDGRGYCDSLAGEWIPIQSRIVWVRDAYGAMTTDRAYRATMSASNALEELRRSAGLSLTMGRPSTRARGYR